MLVTDSKIKAPNLYKNFSFDFVKKIVKFIITWLK